MSLISKNKKDFSVSLKNIVQHGENIVFIKGGAVIIENRWVNISDMRIDVAQLVSKYVLETSRRLFNNFNDIIFILIAIDKYREIKLLPSITYNKKSYGDVKIFSDISGKLPLILVRLQQDGSDNLKSYYPITKNDIEVYTGYGNFTLKGEKGDEGYKGITGTYGETGVNGFMGFQGITGDQGITGLAGLAVQGETGYRGADGSYIPAFILNRE